MTGFFMVALLRVSVIFSAEGHSIKTAAVYCFK